MYFSYFDWSEHWYAYPENTNMDSLGHRKSISVTKENYGSSTLTFFREPFESNELKNTKKLVYMAWGRVIFKLISTKCHLH